jgi:hypothetical protein
VPQKAGTFFGTEVVNQVSKGFPECLHGSNCPCSQQRLQLGERLFNRVQIRTVGRNEHQLRAGALDRLADKRGIKSGRDGYASAMRHALQEIADSQSDVDAYIALIPVEDRARSHMGTEIARRLLSSPVSGASRFGGDDTTQNPAAFWQSPQCQRAEVPA